jgi:glycosyltransferase involved in cell wall biosynthesis
VRRVVIAHDYLTQRGGAERVVLALLQAFPDARVVTSVYDPEGTFPEFAEADIETLFLQRIPPLVHEPRRAFPLLPVAFGRHRIRDADVVVCSSSGWAHGVATDAPKVVYCHTPARWLYEQDDYLAGHRLSVRLAARMSAPPLRRWERSAAASAAMYIANSTTVQERIRRVYNRDSVVVHPPIAFDPQGEQTPVELPFESFLLTIARDRGYKNTAIVQQAAARAGRPLVVVGSSVPSEETSVVRLGRVTNSELRWLYANADVLVAAAHEDFGLTPIEAMALGTPVVAFRRGGYLDTVKEGVTGLFFDRLDERSVAEAICGIDDAGLSREEIARRSRRFLLDGFVTRMREIVAQVARA